MIPAEELANAQTMLAQATTAYQAALRSSQYVQTGQRRMATHDLKDLLASLNYWRDEVRAWDAVVNGTVRRHINAPLRVNL